MSELFTNPIMCYYAIKHESKDIFFEIFYKYATKNYIVALEVAKGKHKQSNGEHFQIIMDMEETTYQNLNKALIKEFNLQGQSRNGIAKQYGKVTKSEIRDIEKACIYTTKDGLFESNIDSEVLKKWYEQSFQKKSNTLEVKNLIEYLDAFYYHQDNDTFYLSDMLDKIKEKIIEYHLDSNYNLPRKGIFSDYVRYYCQYSDKIKNKLEVIKYIYLNNI